MKQLSIFLSGLLTVTSLYSASATFEKVYGSKEDDSARSIIALSDGFLLVGETKMNRDRRSDMYVIKIDPNGNKLWSKAIGGRDDDFGSAAVATKKGFIVVGTTESFGSDRSSVYAVSLDKKGDAKWQHAYFSSDESYYYGSGIVSTSKGYKISGWEDKPEFFDAEVNGYVVDIDADGERTRLRRYGGKDDDKLYDILKTDDGYLLVGESESLRDDEGFDAYVVKIDEKGKVLWQKGYGWGYDEKANAVTRAKNGYIFVGLTESNRDKREEAYVVKIDKTGKVLWQNTYGGRYNEEAFDIVADDDGYVIVGKTDTDSHGRDDLYMFKIDEKGKLLWQRNYGGRADDVAYSVVKTDDGYLVAGETESYGSGRKDVYLLKTDKNGNIGATLK